MLRQKVIAIFVIVAYVLLLPITAYGAIKFLGNTYMEYTPPNSNPARAEQLAKIHFPAILASRPLLVFLSGDEQVGDLRKDHHFKQYSDYLHSEYETASGSLKNTVFSIIGYYDLPQSESIRSKCIGGKFNESTVFRVIPLPHVTIDDLVNNFANTSTTWMDKNNKTYHLEYTSGDMMTTDATDGIVWDFFRIDVVAIPLAFFTLAYCVGSVRLLLVPSFSFPLTFTIAFSVLYPVSMMIEVSTFAPELAMAVMSAISVDYSLFILTRFKEQVKLQLESYEPGPEYEWVVVRNTAVLSAHNILVSGLTIAVALGGLAFLPVAFLSTVGICMSIGSLAAVFVSLTAQPCLLLVFFKFFARSVSLADVKMCYAKCCCNENVMAHLREREEALLEEPLYEDDGDEMMMAQKTPFERKEYSNQINSKWYHIALYSTHHPYVVLVGMCLVGIPFFYLASQMKVDFDIFNMVPTGSYHSSVLQRIVNNVGNGSATPFNVLFVGKNDTNATFWGTDEMMDCMASVTKAVLVVTDQVSDGIVSAEMIPKGYDSRLRQDTYLDPNSSQEMYNSRDKRSNDYRSLVDMTVSRPDKRAAYMALRPPFDPFSAPARDYLDAIYTQLQRYAPTCPNITMGIVGASAPSWAIQSESMRYFPLQIALTFTVIFIVIGLFFRSAFMPFRMIGTVAYTIGISFGVGVLVFQYPWLHFLWKDLERVESYCYLVPIFSFSLLCALALDYDVFVITRIIEYKEMGYTDEAAIAKAVWKTGRIISFAGIIMFITIGALAFSSTLMLAQFGVISGVAVLVDTFIIRPFFVPALLSLVPEAVWTPRVFPELGRGLADMREHLVDLEQMIEEKRLRLEAEAAALEEADDDVKRLN